MNIRFLRLLSLAVCCFLVFSCESDKQQTPVLQIDKLSNTSASGYLDNIPFYVAESEYSYNIEYVIEDERFLRYNDLIVDNLIIEAGKEDEIKELRIKFFDNDTQKVKELVKEMYNKRDKSEYEDESEEAYPEEEQTRRSWKKDNISYEYDEPWGGDRYAELTITFNEEDENEDTY